MKTSKHLSIELKAQLHPAKSEIDEQLLLSELQNVLQQMYDKHGLLPKSVSLGVYQRETDNNNGIPISLESSSTYSMGADNHLHLY